MDKTAERHNEEMSIKLLKLKKGKHILRKNYCKPYAWSHDSSMMVRFGRSTSIAKLEETALRSSVSEEVGNDTPASCSFKKKL